MKREEDNVIAYLNESTLPGVFESRDGVRYWVIRNIKRGTYAVLLQKHGFSQALTPRVMDRYPIALGKSLGQAKITVRDTIPIPEGYEIEDLCECALLELSPDDPCAPVVGRMCIHYFRTSLTDAVARWELTSLSGEVLFKSEEIALPWDQQ